MVNLFDLLLLLLFILFCFVLQHVKRKKVVTQLTDYVMYLFILDHRIALLV